jgi:shikimate O-hydroxycinnamoyltransferase
MQQFLVKSAQAEKRMIECSLSDHFVFRVPVSVAFFYDKPIPSAAIIQALQQVLKDFPVFAGVLIKHQNKLYIDCNNQGVSVKIIHVDSSIASALSQFHQLNSNTFVDIINPYDNLKHKTPVLTIKLNYYKNGLVIGYCWHHSIGDMHTFMAFVKALSACAAGNRYNMPLIVNNRDRYLEQWYDKESLEGNPDLRRLTLMNIIDFVRQKYASKSVMHFYFASSEVNSLVTSMSDQVGYKLSRNDALCAHLLEIMMHYRADNTKLCHASVVINFRKRIEMPENLLGNYIDAIPITYGANQTVADIANYIHLRVKHYLKENFHPSHGLKFIENNGGMKIVNRIIPPRFLPKYKNMIFTNWSKFEVYSVDFGVISPYLFLPITLAPIPWVCSIVEGFNNQGVLMSLTLPTELTQRLAQPAVLEKIHQYRSHLSDNEAETISQYAWCR